MTNTNLRSLRLCLAAGLLTFLAPPDVVQAQGVGIIRMRPVTLPGSIGDAFGSSNSVGTDGGDHFHDHYGGDTDSQHDSPGSPGDGEVDYFDTSDGDNNDSMWGGPEDRYKGDPGDQVYVFDPDSTTLLWHGTFEDYQRIQAIIRWLRDMLQLLRQSVSGVVNADFWRDALQLVSNKIDQVPWPFEPGGPGAVLFADVFSIGPYEFGELPESPLDCLNWMPYAYDVDPVAATAGLKYTSQQFTKSLFTAKALLQHVIDSLEEE